MPVIRYRDCYCGPNVGLMGHKDLMVTLEPETSDAVVVDTRSIEVLQNNCSAL